MDDTKTLGEAGGSLFSQILSGVTEKPKIDHEAETRKLLDRLKQDRAKRALADLESRFSEWLKFDLDYKGLASTREQCKNAIAWKCGGRGMLLAGTHGGGKSRCAFQVARRLIRDEGKNVVWLHAQDLAARICEEMDYGADDARRWIAAMVEVDVLIIDDIGNEDVNTSMKPRVDGWILRLVDDRCSRGKPVIVTTNKGAKQFHAKYGYDRGAALARRLADHCEVIRF